MGRAGASVRMHSKFPGLCVTCGARFRKGAAIVFAPGGEGAKARVYHDTQACAGDASTEAMEPTPVMDEPAPEPAPQAPEPPPSEPDSAPARPEPAPTVPGAPGWLGELARSLIPELERHGFKPSAPHPSEPEVRERIIVVREPAPVPPITIETPHPQFEALLSLAAVRQHVYVYGAPGSGKSHATRMVAAALGLSYRYVSLAPTDMPSRLAGYMDASGRYIRTALRECIEHGGVIAIEEVDRGSPSTLATGLNATLANGIAEFPDAQIPVHQDCVVFALGNTPGAGPTLAFPDARPLDRAFRDRFVFLEWKYDNAHELSITLKSVEAHARTATRAWVAWVQRVRTWATDAVPMLVVSPRASFVGARLLGRFPVATLADMTVRQGVLDDTTWRNLLDACPLPDITTLERGK